MTSHEHEHDEHSQADPREGDLLKALLFREINHLDDAQAPPGSPPRTHQQRRSEMRNDDCRDLIRYLRRVISLEEALLGLKNSTEDEQALSDREIERCNDLIGILQAESEPPTPAPDEEDDDCDHVECEHACRDCGGRLGRGDLVTRHRGGCPPLPDAATRERWAAEDAAYDRLREAAQIDRGGCLFPDAHAPGHTTEQRFSVLFDREGGEWEDLTESEMVVRYGMRDPEGGPITLPGFTHGSDWDFWYAP